MLHSLAKHKSLIDFCQVLNLYLTNINSEIVKNQSDSVSRNSQKFSNNLQIILTKID